MPDDYMSTVNQLDHFLTDDDIGSILECTDAFTANQRILDCLVHQIHIYTEEDFDELLDILVNLGLVNTSGIHMYVHTYQILECVCIIKVHTYNL